MTTISSIIFDCADPMALAAFYAKAIGGKVGDADADFAAVDGGPVHLGFQRVNGYRGPGWPNDGKHAHLDLEVDDLDAARDELVALGAAVPDFQPGDGQWIVLTDPEGHPFCIAGR